LVCGTAALDDVRKLGRIGARTVGLYLLTTAIAISIALGAAVLIGPGVGFGLSTDTTFTAAAAPSLVEVLINLVPKNVVRAMAEGNMLQIIVFAILFGLALTLSGRPGERLLPIFNDLNQAIMTLVWIVMKLAPYGVFALIARTFATQGFDAFGPLLKYFFLVLGVLFLHALVTYPVLLKLLSGLDPFRFISKLREVQVFAFSTASSNATIPVTLKTLKQYLGVKNSVASFTVPLGATINMDGTAIMQGVATVFIAQAYGLGLGLTDYLMVIVTATLASIGTAGVPGVGLIMLSMVLTQVGLPVEGIGLIIGVDRLLDMVRTAVNVTGDSAVSCIVAKREGELDIATYNQKLRHMDAGGS
jgi:Na+/H+-dicarboxylate symporter